MIQESRSSLGCVFFFLLIILVGFGYLLSNSLHQYENLSDLRVTIAAFELTKKAADTMLAPTATQFIKATQTPVPSPRVTATNTPTIIPEPPEITVARITTLGTVIVGFLSLIGVLISSYVVLRSTRIKADANKRKDSSK